MVPLSGDAAAAMLRSWMLELQQPTETPRHLIHFHTLLPPAPTSSFEELAAFKRWRDGGPRAIRDAWDLLDRSIDRAAYIQPALAARAVRTQILRIFLLPETALEAGSGDWRRYFSEVQYAYFAEEADETLAVLPLQAYLAFFETAPATDLTQYGHGIIVTSYTEAGLVDARKFYDPSTNEAAEYRKHMRSITTLAASHRIILRQAKRPR